jgi:threonine/homoserine efflux transporter RhtA
MIIESGVIIFIGLLLLFIKLPHKWRLSLLGHSLALDITVSVVAYILHAGTFSGMMAAAVAGLMCSAMTSIGKNLIGYTRRGKYYPGKWNIKGAAL